MKKTLKISCCRINIGDKIIEKKTGRVGVLKDICLMPNSFSSKELVAILYVGLDTGGITCSTSERWIPQISEMYEEFYPSLHLGELDNPK